MNVHALREIICESIWEEQKRLLKLSMESVQDSVSASEIGGLVNSATALLGLVKQRDLLDELLRIDGGKL